MPQTFLDPWSPLAKDVSQPEGPRVTVAHTYALMYITSAEAEVTEAGQR